MLHMLVGNAATKRPYAGGALCLGRHMRAGTYVSCLSGPYVQAVLGGEPCLAWPT
jgi:hypothetical protein